MSDESGNENPRKREWNTTMLELQGSDTGTYLAGRWSWGRLYGVQTGSPTKSRIA